MNTTRSILLCSVFALFTLPAHLVAQAPSDDDLNARALKTYVEEQLNQVQTEEELNRLGDDLTEAGLLSAASGNEVILEACGGWAFSCGGKCSKATKTLGYSVPFFGPDCVIESGTCEATWYLGCACNYTEREEPSEKRCREIFEGQAAQGSGLAVVSHK